MTARGGEGVVDAVSQGGELLGLRWRDVDLDADLPSATIAETLIGARQDPTP
jgi:integrase